MVKKTLNKFNQHLNTPNSDKKKYANEFNHQFTPHQITSDKTIISKLLKRQKLDKQHSTLHNAEKVEMFSKATNTSKTSGLDLYCSNNKDNIILST